MPGLLSWKQTILIAAMTAGIALAGMRGHALAQGASPFPDPNAPARSSSPFPDPNAAARPQSSPFPNPNASGGSAAPFPNAAPPVSGGFGNPGAPAGGGFGGPPPGQLTQEKAQACVKEFAPLRSEAEKRANLIKAASQRKAPPDEACKLIKNFASAEAKMVSFMGRRGSDCGIPPQAVQQMKASHGQTQKLLQRVCNAAQAGPGRASAPSLSDALGTTSVPDNAARPKGGSTFDTLSGNVLAR